MKATLVLAVFLVVMFDQINPSDTLREQCRKIHTVSRCIERRFSIEGKRWCVFHLCAPKWIFALPCPAGETQATHKCKVKNGPVRTWVCNEVPQIKSLMLPIGCTAGHNCTEEVPTCLCHRRVNQDRATHEVVNSISRPSC